MRHRRHHRSHVYASRSRLVRSIGPVAVVILLVATLATVADGRNQPASAPAASPIMSPLPDIAEAAWTERGRVIRTQPYADAPIDHRDSVLGAAWKGVYASVSGVDGQSREVHGAFFVPTGVPPESGWPVVALAHGTTGVGNNCGPAEQPDLMGYGPVIEALLNSKYAVALSDYEGLGPTGEHFYLEPRTAAFNTIDGVRAFRAISPAVSRSWVAFGYSQGGQAAWAANELDSFYGQGLRFLGSAVLAPAANVSGVADLAWSRSMSDEQRAVYPLLITGLARYNPDLDTARYLHGTQEQAPRRLSRCEVSSRRTDSPPAARAPWQVIWDRTRESTELAPETASDAEALRVALRKVALPQHRLDGPMLVVTGSSDTLVLPSWVQAATAASCATGGRVEYVEMPGVDHRGILWKSSDLVSAWIADRFAGAAAPTNCADVDDDPRSSSADGRPPA